MHLHSWPKDSNNSTLQRVTKRKGKISELISLKRKNLFPLNFHNSIGKRLFYGLQKNISLFILDTTFEIGLIFSPTFNCTLSKIITPKQRNIFGKKCQSEFECWDQNRKTWWFSGNCRRNVFIQKAEDFMDFSFTFSRYRLRHFSFFFLLFVFFGGELFELLGHLNLGAVERSAKEVRISWFFWYTRKTTK